MVISNVGEHLSLGFGKKDVECVNWRSLEMYLSPSMVEAR